MSDEARSQIRTLEANIAQVLLGKPEPIRTFHVEGLATELEDAAASPLPSERPLVPDLR